MICEVGKKYFAWERRDPDALHAVYTHTHNLSLSSHGQVTEALWAKFSR